jgi:hypothetical protein
MISATGREPESLTYLFPVIENCVARSYTFGKEYDSILYRGSDPWSLAMKHVIGILVLVLALAVFAGAKQSSSAEPAPQGSSDGARATAGKATSHARHARKQRSGNHHRRPRTTAKSHKS